MERKCLLLFCADLSWPVLKGVRVSQLEAVELGQKARTCCSEWSSVSLVHSKSVKGSGPGGSGDGIQGLLSVRQVLGF